MHSAVTNPAAKPEGHERSHRSAIGGSRSLPREVLAQAEEALGAADLRLGAIRTLLRRKALPLIFSHETEFQGFPPRTRPIVNDGYASDDSRYSVSVVSESGLVIPGS